MNLADYRRFVSYIYAYRNGKKEKNTGFAKVEARKRNLRISIQLEASGNRETSLDAYGFIRKGEKIFGIFLGEMEKSSGPLYFLKVETDTDNIKESGYGLNQLSGLWIKGEPGENYITIWDDEPVKRMELEIEMEMEDEKPAEREMLEKAPAEILPETPPEKPLNGVRAQEAELIAGLEASETDLLEAEPDPDEDCVPEEIMPEPPAVKITASAAGYTERYVTLWERLAPACAHRNPFQDGEAADAILISPRELHFFCCKNWSAAKNSFIYHGYYNFHYLLFGKAADGSFFLAVPGTYSPQEQRMAASFGFPLFKESREKAPSCRRGYWCRLL